nr:MAG: replication initiator protein [Microviridae sp.]
MLCLSPLSFPRPNGLGNSDRITVPCGKCMACLSRKRAQWSFRLNQEFKVSSSAYFITLTYDDDHFTGEINKREIQLFLKRLRQFNSKVVPTDYVFNKKVAKARRKPSSVRYFLVGEYGSITGRPHYHIILFNFKPVDDMFNVIKNIWGAGLVHIGDVNIKSIMYAAKYILQEETNIDKDSFMMCSKNLGISYVEKMKAYHNENHIHYGIESHGVKTCLPRYYRDKIFSKDIVELNSYNNQIMNDVKNRIKENQLLKMGINPHELELQSKVQYSAKIKKSIKEIKKTNL